MFAGAPDPLNRNLRVHGVVLGLLLCAYVGLVVWAFQQPERPLDFTRLGAILAIVPVSGYAFVTSVALAFVRRRRGGALVVHGIALVLCGALIAIGRAVEEADAADPPAVLAQRASEGAIEGMRESLAVQAIRAGVTPRGALVGEVTLVNRGPAAHELRDVDLMAFPRAGANEIFRRDVDGDAILLRPGQSVSVAMHGVFPVEPGASVDGWDYRVNVATGAPTSSSLCFTTDGAPATTGCASIPRQAIARIEVFPPEPGE